MKKNIVIIGMSGVGKSSKGRYIANSLGWDFIDTDELITNRENMSIDEIFTKFGEDHFRNIETNIIKELSSLKNTVISTGGGIVLKEENIVNLKKNGYIYLFQGRLETIVNNLNESKVVRPLLKEGADLSESVLNLLMSRENLYILYSDILINIDGITNAEAFKVVITEYEKLEKIYN